MPAGQGIADVDAVTHRKIHRDVGEQFEAGEAAGGLVLRNRQQLERVGRRLQADIGGFHRVRFWEQPQRRRGDDAERAFGADEQVAQIVAGIVLLQLRQRVQHAPVGEHHFQPERHLARHAIGQRRGTAGIGGEVAADGAASFGAERQRKQAVDVAGALLRDLQHHAGLAGHGVGRGVDVADAVHPPHRHHHLAMMRGLPADQAGIAALRHQRDALLGGEPADRGHLRGRTGPQHQRRAAVIEVALLGEVRRDVGRIGDRISVADNGAKARDQFGRERRCRHRGDIHGLVSASVVLDHSRPIAARRRRSLMASPRP